MVSSASSAVGVPETLPDVVFKLSQEGFAPTTLNVLYVGASITESNKVNAVIAEFLVKVVGIPVTVALQETSAVTIGKVTYLVCEPLSSVAVIITLVVKSFWAEAEGVPLIYDPSTYNPDGKFDIVKLTGPVPVTSKNISAISTLTFKVAGP